MPLKIQDNKRKALIRAKKKLTSVLNVIDAIIDNNESEVSACRRYNINLNQFRRLVTNKYLSMAYNQELRKQHDDMFLNSYDKIFIEVIKGMPNEKFYYDNMPGHLEENLKLVMAEKLTKNERLVMHQYYIEGNTLDEIGKSLGKTREYMRLIKEKALEKLRYEFTFDMILYGPKTADIIEAKRIENTNKLIKLKLDELDISSKIEESFDINNLNISKRLKNVLLQNNIDNLTDVIYHTYDEIANFTNMGAGCLKELTNICQKYHIPFKQYESNLPKEDMIYDINFIEMSPRLKHALAMQDLFDIRDLANLSIEEIKEFPCIGIKSINELIDICKNLDIKFAE